MKRAYLIVVIALILGSCEKDDPIVDDAPKSTLGKVTFFVSTDDKDKIDFPIKIYVNDSLVEDRLNGAASGNPNCDEPSTLGRRVYLDAGSYSWKALDEFGLWGDSGTVTVEADICKLQRMQ